MKEIRQELDVEKGQKTALARKKEDDKARGHRREAKLSKIALLKTAFELFSVINYWTALLRQNTLLAAAILETAGKDGTINTIYDDRLAAHHGLRGQNGPKYEACVKRLQTVPSAQRPSSIHLSRSHKP